MQKAYVALMATIAAVCATAAQGQGPGAVDAGRAGGAGTSWAAPRTPWGHPDLQGIWTSGYVETPLERPDVHKGREFLTDEEIRAEQKRLNDRQDHSTGGAQPIVTRADDPGTYNTVFSGRGRDVIRTRRTSFVIDPPDGKIPWKPEVRAKVTADVRLSRTGAVSILSEDNERGGDGPEDRPNDRCRGIALPHQYGTIETGGAHYRLVQSPAGAAFYYEYGPHGGAYRAVPTDGRPHLAPTVRLWLGDAVGRWEGESLVVDTTNFSHQTNYQGSKENLHLVERFTRVSPDLLMYHATIEDPTVFTRPWTIEVPFTRRDDKANQIFESSCHEGNYGLTGILAGARELEREQAAPKRAK